MKWRISPGAALPIVAGLLLAAPAALPGEAAHTALSLSEIGGYGEGGSPAGPPPSSTSWALPRADLGEPQEPGEVDPSEPSPGERLTVFLLTVGQGDAIWERFSHNAIWIRDEESGWEAAFNWGIFDFDQVDFIPRLIRGTMLYRMEPWDPTAYLEQTRREDRAAWLQELALTPEQKWELLTYVQWNARPENTYYRYDYYRDNCSTRVRDALDRVLGGRIRAATEPDTTTHTYRWHTRRLLGNAPWAYLGIQTVLGPAADRPLTEWEDAFLPLRLMESVREVQVPDGDGGMRPLVEEERQLLDTSRPPVPSRPPNALPWFLLVGVLWGGAILGLSWKGSQLGFPARLALAALGGGWSLVAALAGTLLLGAWFFTDHVFWYRNLNLLQVNPLFLLSFLAFVLFLFRGAYPGWARPVAVLLATIAGVGLLLHLFPVPGQANGEILALTLPLNGALALGSARLLSGRPASHKTPPSHEKEPRSEGGEG